VTPERVLELLARVASGELDVGEAMDRLSWLPVERVEPNGSEAAWARLDHHRAVRQGIPEAVYCPGKTTEQIIEICRRFAERGSGFLVTRAEATTRAAVLAVFPTAVVNAPARAVWLPSSDIADRRAAAGNAVTLVVAAGTADVPVAEEAVVSLETLGRPVERLYDVGVAGLHRVLGSEAELRRAAVVIAVAGMDGALPSVIGGLVGSPVIAVPTSTGYGTSFGGIAALLTMLNSCASGVTVVNVDNGYGAACAAARILHSVSRVGKGDRVSTRS
jgi:NCAIR mutase (PurE)-related protein